MFVCVFVELEKCSKRWWWNECMHKSESLHNSDRFRVRTAFFFVVAPCSCCCSACLLLNTPAELIATIASMLAFVFFVCDPHLTATRKIWRNTQQTETTKMRSRGSDISDIFRMIYTDQTNIYVPIIAVCGVVRLWLRDIGNTHSTVQALRQQRQREFQQHSRRAQTVEMPFVDLQLHFVSLAHANSFVSFAVGCLGNLYT